VALVRFLPDEAALEAGPADTLMDVAVRGGVPIASACGGEAACSTCRVLVVDGHGHLAAPDPDEAAVLSALGAGPSLRLACRARPLGDVTVRRLVIDEEDERLVDRRLPGAAAARVGEERLVAVLFADIRGFTAFSESVLPYDVVHVLTRFYALAEAAMSRHEGRIATYMGDGFMAIFENAPGGDMPALRAVRAGLDLIDAVARWHSYLELAHGRALEVSVGVHHGPAVVGALGSGDSRIVTAVGDVVNTAARIEQANRAFGTALLVSDDVARALGDRLETAAQQPISLPGKKGHHVLHAVQEVR
jgi:adenylate cyclase